MPCDYKNYPKNWKKIRNEILERAKNQCECTGQCGFTHVELIENKQRLERGHHVGIRAGRCSEKHLQRPLYFGGKRVILTIAHLNHKTKDSRRKNLLALCQVCHLRLDASMKAAKRRIANFAKAVAQSKIRNFSK